MPIVPNRGVITDRNGVVLAQSYSAYTLELTPSQDQQPRGHDRRAVARSSTSSRATASASRSSSTSRRTSRACRFARGCPTRKSRASPSTAIAFPGVEIKARLFRQYPYGEIASHVIGYIGRINDKDLERIAGWDETANYKGSDYIGKVGVELSYERELHGTTGCRGSRGRRRRARGAHAVAHAADVRQQPARCRSTSSCRRSAEQAFGDRRGALVAIDPATGDVLAFVSQARLRPEPVRRGHRSANWELAQRFARQAAAESSAARRVSAGLDDQAVPRTRAR